MYIYISLSLSLYTHGGVGYTNGRLFEAFFAGRKKLHSAESTLIILISRFILQSP